ncbi:DUF2867 domain-containing protein [Bradyrhizobium aeschynomenes]|uniref:DUF2867 domain-containing protein n=1 Tax=Bradyrhizobium aeschynomenes TaxID=2734909 RepID=UPI0015557E6B|nr:DUF2867 domain-containing protein [Bradyrhizobium aeschynomenes]NPV24945.1 DUF2867 domain-containing protein [Bradyrhizobium aeschynomenes]
MTPGRSSTSIQETSLPVASLIDRALLLRSDYRESMAMELSRSDLSTIDIFFAIFGHRPGWMKAVLILRNTLAAPFGLEVSRGRDILSIQRKPAYSIGEKMLGWTIFVHTADELIVGRDNAHLDFRVSILREHSIGQQRIVISTICDAHNAFGVAYLKAVLPFHKRGFRWLIKRARACGRL